MPMSILDNICENQAIPTINANGAKLRRNKYNFALQSLRAGNSIFRFSPDTRGVDSVCTVCKRVAKMC